ncbi:MAG TPA: redoxin domain-containing protein [Opitutaceae bacterium]|nr:redoxin domain-containing protein [Opitutaceae bacterium]
MISIGKKLQTDFKLKVVQNGAQKEVAFADLLTRPTIVSVYMRNNTGSCDKQNASLIEAADELNKLGYNLVAISRDSCGSHLKYAEKKGIIYSLASDREDLFSKAADSIVEKSMYGRKYMGPARAAFVLGKDGTVLGIVERVDSANHAVQLKALLSTLR